MLDFFQQAFTADEIARCRLPGDAPAQVRSQRRMGFVDVLAIQVHAGFQAQGVARTKAARGNAGADQVVEKCRGLDSGEDDFQAILTGVTGAGDKPVAVGQAFERFQFTDQRGACGSHQFSDLFPCVRALDGQDGQFRAFAEFDFETDLAGLQPGHVLVAGRSVDHQAVTVFTTVDDHIVDDSALLVEHGAVQGLAGSAKAVDIVGQHMLQPRAGLDATDIDHGHVGYIEYAAGLAHLMVLLDLRSVMQRHIPTAKIDHLGAKCQVQVIKRRTLSHGFLLPGVARLRLAALQLPGL
ncbi:hypothetical protein D3C81_760500 [compost metagenome]